MCEFWQENLPELPSSRGLEFPILVLSPTEGDSRREGSPAETGIPRAAQSPGFPDISGTRGGDPVKRHGLVAAHSEPSSVRLRARMGQGAVIPVGEPAESSLAQIREAGRVAAGN